MPIVEKKHAPLIFRRHLQGDELVKSTLFNVYEPSDEKEQVWPHILITPVLGFMDDCHRIGYGGGFYDRTIHQL